MLFIILYSGELVCGNHSHFPLLQNDAFSVSVVDGKISVTSSVEDRRTTLETNMNKYNDGAWHYITVTKRSKE